MTRRKLTMVGIATAAVAMMALGTGTATAAEKITGHCVDTNFCYAPGYFNNAGGNPVAVDGDLTHAPGQTLTLELLVNGHIVCTIGPIPESAPAGSWICNGVPHGVVDVRGYTGTPVRGDFFVQARIGG